MLRGWFCFEEQNSYTADEMKQMNDYMMIAEVISKTGKVMLRCEHCKKDIHIKNFLHSIRKRCDKKGLDLDFKLPKTCDRQQAVNYICNPINNTYTSKKKALEKKKMSIICSEQEKQKLKDCREFYLAKVGIKANVIN